MNASGVALLDEAMALSKRVVVTLTEANRFADPVEHLLLLPLIVGAVASANGLSALMAALREKRQGG